MQLNNCSNAISMMEDILKIEETKCLKLYILVVIVV